jgi:uncharacterized protein YjbJ (UPF0337 family)
MNWERIEGNWEQFQGKVLEFWDKFPETEVDIIGGQRNVLSSRIQEIYGVSKDQAEQQIRRFEKSLSQDRPMRADGDSRRESRVPQR